MICTSPPAPTEAARPPLSVLVVEDDDASIALLQVRFAHLGCDVTIATSEYEALAYAKSRHFDLVVLDLKLGHDHHAGESVLAELETLPAFEGVPVVLHSVYVKHASDSHELTARVAHVLRKPSPLKALRDIVEQVRRDRLPA